MKSWLRFLLSRLGSAIVVVWFVISAVFAMTYLLPADPARAVVGPHADAETIARVRIELCLDQGFLTQYNCHVGRLAKLDLGTSFRTGRPVAAIVAERIGPTAQLAFSALTLTLALALPLALLGIRRRAGFWDRSTTVAVWILQAIPPFVMGPILVLCGSYRWGFFPSSGAGELGLDRLQHLALPALTLALGGVAAYTRLLVGELARVRSMPLMRVARAKGVSEMTAMVRHGFPIAVGPIVAVMGVDLGVLLGGTAMTEYIFGWPGLGREAVLGVLELDLPLVLGVVFVTGIAVVLANLVADIVHAVVDPRIRPQ